MVLTYGEERPGLRRDATGWVRVEPFDPCWPKQNPTLCERLLLARVWNGGGERRTRCVDDIVGVREVMQEEQEHAAVRHHDAVHPQSQRPGQRRQRSGGGSLGVHERLQDQKKRSDESSRRETLGSAGVLPLPCAHPSMHSTLSRSLSFGGPPVCCRKHVGNAEPLLSKATRVEWHGARR